MRRFVNVTAIAACVVLSVASYAGEMSNRWVYVSVPMTEDANVATISNVVVTAKVGGFNGMLLSCGLDFLRFWPKDRMDRLMAVKRICDDNGIEIIPAIWSFGYGALQNYGMSALEGVPVEGSPFVARGNDIVFDEASAVRMNIDAKPSEWQRTKGFFRAIQRIKVSPHRRYRYRFEFRTVGLESKQPFKVSVVDCGAQKQWHEKERITVEYKPTQDWTPVTYDFNSIDSSEYYLYTGFWSGVEKGSVELRSQTLTEIPPCDVLLRPGAPRTLRGAVSGKVYEEGRDYTVPRPTYPAWKQGKDVVRLVRTASSSIKDGESLVFDAYAPAVVDGQQVSICLSEPDLYERVVADSAAQIERVLSPKSWLISIDEFRNGNLCAACRERNRTMGQIYADAITRLHGIIRKTHPGADILMWSDMIDPNHNAVAPYYNSRGGFVDAWKGIPKDITIACWYDRKSELSMKFFSERGFRTLAAAYYDETPPFEYSRRWRDLVRRTDGARGIMYTTWRHNYRDFPAFMKMVNEPTDKCNDVSPCRVKGSSECGGKDAAYPDRLVFLPCNFWGKEGEAHSYGFFTNVVQRAHKAGYNGVILSAHLDLMHTWGNGSYLSNRVVQAKAFCDSLGMDLVPMTWDVGYGGDCPPNWFESRTVADLPYVRSGDRAIFDPPSVTVEGGPTAHMSFSGDVGRQMPMRPTRRFKLRKGVRYVLTVRAKSTDVPESDLFQFIGFVPSANGKAAYYSSQKFPHDGKWHDLVFPFEAKTDEEVTMVFGHWGKVGRLELSDFKVRARGICGATRRDGIPFIVKDAASGVVYVEGRDYATVPPIKVRGEGEPLGPYLELSIPANSSIADGARLLVTADIPSRFGDGERAQYAACMSNEDWYKRAEMSARVIGNVLRPRRWFLCFDELRSANSCAACRARNIDMAHLIGECLTRQREIVRKVSPDAVCYVWGDMLDPNHNAKEGYAFTHGSYDGIAGCIPKDLVIVPWWGEKAAEQIEYWHANGFRVCPGAYYDCKDQKNERSWIKAAGLHPESVTGFVFCTWRMNFDELENFANLMFGSHM